MTALNNGRGPVPQSRQVHRSYKLPIEARAALAVDLIENGGWPLKDAAASLCVNRKYPMLARRLADADRRRLARSELKLAQVCRDYCQRLAELATQREQAEREATEAARDQLEQSERQAPRQRRHRDPERCRDREHRSRGRRRSRLACGRQSHISGAAPGRGGVTDQAPLASHGRRLFSSHCRRRNRQ